MKAIFTLASPRPGELVSGIEIDVHEIFHYFTNLDCNYIQYLEEGKQMQMVCVKETPEEIAEIIKATLGKSTGPSAQSDTTPTGGPTE